jgi:integrase
MANIRIRPNNIIQYDVCVHGVRFRETSGLKATPVNVKKTLTTLKKINAQLALNTFEYREFFPLSKKVDIFETLRREKDPRSASPYFDTYSTSWVVRHTHQWKNSYLNKIKGCLNRYLLPHFGNTQLEDIDLAQVQAFRTSLMAIKKEDGGRLLSNKRINIILVPLISMLHLAFDELDIQYALERLKPLKEEPSDPKPLSQKEVELFLQVVPPQWHDYHLIRFYTGMRSCEVHGLKIDCIDVNHDIIRVRRNWVNGELTDVKTPKSRRDINMSPSVKSAIERCISAMPLGTDYLFTSEKGKPLDTRYVSQNLWYPTLLKAGISPRRPYQTRHTAAVLHLAAHENPLFVSRLLGHSGTRMLYEVYAPYVQNAVGSDGYAFEQMMSNKG